MVVLSAVLIAVVPDLDNTRRPCGVRDARYQGRRGAERGHRDDDDGCDCRGDDFPVMRCRACYRPSWQDRFARRSSARSGFRRLLLRFVVVRLGASSPEARGAASLRRGRSLLPTRLDRAKVISCRGALALELHSR